MDEVWRVIPEFPDYEISSEGRVLRADGRFISVTYTNHGHAKVNLVNPEGFRFTRSVAVLVAEAFVDPPNERCDQVIILDGNLQNVVWDNLMWRPRWFAWKYHHQLNQEQPTHYHNVAVRDVETRRMYRCVIDAGMLLGLLFYDIWRSTYQHTPIFPIYHEFEIVGRV